MSTFSEDQQLAYDSCMAGENVFITGPGGTGKSFLIKSILSGLVRRGKRVQVCSTTGCSSVLLNCNARTLHSWAGIGSTNIDFDTIVTRIKMNRYKRKNWMNVDVLIIDEVSMLSKSLFELLDQIGKQVRMTNSKYHAIAGKPFGGIQLVACGDFFQLPPVPTQGDPDSDKMCFESPLWDQTFDSQILLDKIFRQKNEEYLKILNEVRQGYITKSSVEILKKYIRGKGNDIENDPANQPVTLFSTKRQANDMNARYMNDLDGEDFVMECEVVYEPSLCIECKPKLGQMK